MNQQTPHRQQRNTARCGGFTLIEIMLVILIVGLIVGVASANLDNRSGISQRVALKEFANHLAMVLSESALSGKAWGIRLEKIPQGQEGNDSDADLYTYHWVMLQDDQTWKYAKPLELEEKYSFPESSEITLLVENNPAEITTEILQPDEDNTLKPQIILLPDGEVSAFSAEITAIDNEDKLQPGLLLSVDNLGRITLPKAEE